MNQGMQQKMVAGAAMQQTMRILQANVNELHQLVSHALQTNPTLEERSNALEDERSDQLEKLSGYYNALEQVSEKPSLVHHLSEQITQEDLSPELTDACLFLIGSLDSRGYLDAQDVPDESIYTKALKIIQQLEPAGVGARDLRECLQIQLKQAGEGDSLTADLLRDHWDSLVQHQYARVATQLGIEELSVREAAERLKRLQSNPANDYSEVDSSIILPDVLVEEAEDGELLVSLTGEYIPQLAISADYRSMMAEKSENKELREYLSRCFREARDLISAIEQRQHSVLQAARAIVVRQEEFFRVGVSALRPLKMEQIAEDTGVHLSTISRAVRGKYIKCRFGVFELRSFFQHEIKSETGGETTAHAVQQRIMTLISEEDKRSPLSDSDLVSQLAEEGVYVARRTVAKYRDQLGIPPAQQRK